MCEPVTIAATTAAIAEGAAATAATTAAVAGTTAAATAGVGAIVAGTAATSAVVGTAAAAAGAGLTGLEIAGLAVSAGSAGLGYYQQQQLAERNTSSQQASYTAQMQQLQTQQQQINQQASEQMSARAQAAQAAQARLRVSAGESGVSGISEDRLSNEISLNEGQDIATIDKNRRAQLGQSAATGRGIAAQTQSAINSTPGGNLLGAALQIGTTYVGTQQRRPTSGVQTS